MIFIGFDFNGSAVKLKVENTSGSARIFYIQPNVSGSSANAGTWSNLSAGSTSGNYWSLPGSTTGTATFTFPANYDGNGRIYTNSYASSLRFYSMNADSSALAGIDSLIDTPTNYSVDSGNPGGNYCTLNPLDKATNAVLTNGNLQQSYTSGTGAIRGTFAYPKTGKWYYEVTPLASQYSTGYFHVGIATADANLNTNPGYDTTNEFTYWQSGAKTNAVSYGASFTAGDVIGVAFDADAGSLTFYKTVSAKA